MLCRFFLFYRQLNSVNTSDLTHYNRYLRLTAESLSQAFDLPKFEVYWQSSAAPPKSSKKNCEEKKDTRISKKHLMPSFSSFSLLLCACVKLDFFLQILKVLMGEVLPEPLLSCCFSLMFKLDRGSSFPHPPARRPHSASAGFLRGPHQGWPSSKRFKFLFDNTRNYGIFQPALCFSHTK